MWSDDASPAMPGIWQWTRFCKV